MFCTQCGSNNSDNAKFCAKCGAQLTAAGDSAFGTAAPHPQIPIQQASLPVGSQQPYTPAAPLPAPAPAEHSYAPATPVNTQQPYAFHAPTPAPALQGAVKKRSKLPIIIVAVLAVILIAVTAVFLLPKMLGCGGTSIATSKYAYAEVSLLYSYSKISDSTTIIINGTPNEKTIPGDAKMIATDRGSKYLVSSDDNGLYLITATGIKKVADEANTGRLSSDGRKGVYGNEDGVYLFDASVDGNAEIEPEKISNDSTFLTAIFSPDGETMIYGTMEVNYNNSGGSNSSSSLNSKYELKLYKDGKVSLFHEDAEPISVSNGGEYIYFMTTEDGAMCVGSAKTSIVQKLAIVEKPIDNIPVFNFPIINEDHTEMVFSTQDATYYVEKDGKAQKIGQSAGLYPAMVSPSNTIYNGEARSLKDKYYWLDGELVYLDNNAKATQLGVNSDYVRMSSDGEALYYLENESLFRADISAGVGANIKPKEIADKVISFEISEDQKHVYCIDTDNNLQHVDVKGQITEIMSGVSRLSTCVNGRIYFLVDTGITVEISIDSYTYNDPVCDMYYVQDGGDAVEFEQDVYDIKVDESNKYMRYYINNNGDAYLLDLVFGDPLKLG